MLNPLNSHQVTIGALIATVKNQVVKPYVLHVRRTDTDNGTDDISITASRRTVLTKQKLD